MDTHDCKQENLLGGMASDISNIKEGQDGLKVTVEKGQSELKVTVNKIFDRLEGKNGLISKVAVHESRWANMPSPKSIIIQASIWGGFTGAAITIGKLVFFK